MKDFYDLLKSKGIEYSLKDGKITVNGNLDLYGCSWLTALPDNLIVNGYVWLTNCSGLTALPNGLAVKRWLGLSGCTGLTTLPNDMKVGICLYLRGCTYRSAQEGITAFNATATEYTNDHQLAAETILKHDEDHWTYWLALAVLKGVCA